jgi:hypothetical protein
MSHLAKRCGSFVFICQMPLGVVKLDRRQSEARSGEFIKAREAARLPDDAVGFRVCGEVVT